MNRGDGDGESPRHSLAEFRELIFACLDAAGARSVVEIGCEEGLFTRELIRWAEQHQARLACVEPEPAPSLRELVEASPAARLLAETSLEALEHLEPADAYVVDGDHNFYTVSRELRAIDDRAAASSGGTYLAFFHDIGWPWGRRDMYYAPHRLPADAVGPHTFVEGITLDSAGTLGPGLGFRGEGDFAWALEEGGPANGVLTAVEEFLESRDDMRLVKVPGIFGLGVLYRASAPYAEELTALLAPYDGNPLLERLEHDRLTLLLRSQQLGDELGRLGGVEAENQALRARLAELEAQVADLNRRRADLRARADQLGREVDSVIRSRAFVLAEKVSQAHARAGGGPGLSRARLQAALDDVWRDS